MKKKFIYIVFAIFCFSCDFSTSSKNSKGLTKRQDTLKGIDVSHFNDIIDWSLVKKANIAFAYAKATEGELFQDPQFKNNWLGMKHAGIKRGAYHFYVPQDSPDKQAAFFLSVLGNQIGELPIALDLEGSLNEVAVEDYQNKVLKWLTIVKNKTGVKPIIYCNPSFANKNLKNDTFSDYKLWLADYNKTPVIPLTWKNKSWYLLQHTDQLKIKGTIGKFDGDIMILK